MKKLMTLCFIRSDDKLLLALKKRGFGMGRWNGYGGKVAEGETVEQAVSRELFEESQVESTELSRRGVLEFSFEGDPTILEVHVFQVLSYRGIPIETEEMKPDWFSLDSIPYSEMWPDDIHWLGMFLAGEHFSGKFHFKDSNTILSAEVKKLDCDMLDEYCQTLGTQGFLAT